MFSPPPKPVVLDENGLIVEAVEKKQPKINALQLYEFNKRKLNKPFDWVVQKVIKRGDRCYFKTFKLSIHKV